jgi:hypothetical protein
MDWDETRAALLLLAEERVGHRVRQIGAEEDARHDRSVAILRAEEARRGPR